MTRLLGLLVIVAGLFYVAWPAYTGWQIRNALEAGNESGLEAGIDFPKVRESLRPYVTAKMEENLKKVTTSAGGGTGALADQLKTPLVPKMVDGVLNAVVTPPGLIRIYREGKTLKEAVSGLAAKNPDLVGQIGGLLGGLLGKDISIGGLGKAPEAASGASSTTASGSKTKTPMGIDNIKSFAFHGPTAFSLGIARDAKADKADLTATMAFTGSGWQVTGLVPAL